MADMSTCFSLIESITIVKLVLEDNKKKELFKIRISSITKINGRTNVAFKNVVFRDEFLSLQAGVDLDRDSDRFISE